MKIVNSSVAMASHHQESQFLYVEKKTMEASASENLPGAILELSKEDGENSYLDNMREYERRQKQEMQQRQAENEQKHLQEMAKRLQRSDNRPADMLQETEPQIKMLRQMLAILRGEKYYEESKVHAMPGVADFRSAAFRLEERTAMQTSLAVLSAGTTTSGSVWEKVTATEGFFSEMESSTFATEGFVQTQDGRNIAFHVEVTMSQAFMSKIQLLESETYIQTDPLMINLEGNVGKVSDQKFFFDLNQDGKEEEISFAGNGSGFLALDKNGDGKINDGSELFGTQSGDGFGDLSVYDEDKNGWIDENDSIYQDLRVWTKDEEGRDFLIDLKKADVGAIYLGNADTQFSLKDDANHLNGEIKKTGIYLKEHNGAVGTLNHVDLVI